MVAVDLAECSLDLRAGEMPTVRGPVTNELAHHVIAKLEVVLLGDALIVVVIEEDRASELCRPASNVPPLESSRAMADEG